MNTRLNIASAILTMFVNAGLIACGGDSPNDASSGSGGDAQQTNGKTPILSATIGAKGGTIEGKKGTPFEGFRLDIPAGALSADTEITVEPGSDTTPLPAHAEKVGPQFTITPADVTLAKAASLTLPVDTHYVQRFGQGPSDAKVWIRQQTGWTKAEATHTAEGSVTIDLDELTTAASGVTLTGLDGGNTFCITTGLCDPPTPPKCQSSTGFCVTELSVSRFVPTDSAATQFWTDGADSIFHVATFFNPSRIGVVRESISKGDSTQSTQLEGQFFTQTVRLNPLVDAAGVAWVAETGRSPSGPSNLSFQFDKKASSATDLDIGLGLIELGNGSIVRLRTDGRTLVAKGQPTASTGAFTAWPAGTNPALNSGGARAAADLSTPDSFWAAVDSVTLKRYSASSNAGVQTVRLTEQDFGYPMSSAPAQEGGGVALVTVNGHVFRIVAGKTAISFQNVPLAFDLAFDKDGGLWVAPREAAPIMYYRTAENGPAPTGFVTSVVLSSAAPGSDDYVNAIPRAIRALDDGSVIVLRRDGKFIRVRRNGT